MQLLQVLAVLALLAACSATAVVREDVEGIRNVQHRDNSKNDAFFDSIPQYDFSYRIHDAVTGDAKDQREERHGGLVQGSYSLVEPDGTLRHVKYTADDVNGFKAVVTLTPGHSPPNPSPLRSIHKAPGVIHHYIDAPVPVQHPQHSVHHNTISQTASGINRRVQAEHPGPVIQQHHLVQQVQQLPGASAIQHHGVQVPVVHHGLSQQAPILHPVPLVHNIPLVYQLQQTQKEEEAVKQHDGKDVQHREEGVVLQQQEGSVQQQAEGGQQDIGVVQRQTIRFESELHQGGVQPEGLLHLHQGLVQQDVQQQEAGLQQGIQSSQQEGLRQDAELAGAVHQEHSPPQVLEVRHSIQPAVSHQQRSIDEEQQLPGGHQHFLYRTSAGGNYIRFHSPYASYEII